MFYAAMREVINLSDWVMSMEMFKEFLKSIKTIQEGGNLNMKEVEDIITKYFQGRSIDKKVGLQRHMFLDLLVLIAKKKYAKKQNMSLLNSIKTFFHEEGFSKTVKSYQSPSLWRSQNLYSQEIAWVFRKHEAVNF